MSVSEFNRRWKREVAGLTHHTHQHTGGLISPYHSVSTDVYTHTLFLVDGHTAILYDVSVYV